MNAWQQYAAIKRLLEDYGLLNMEPGRYDVLNRKLIEILGL